MLRGATPCGQYLHRSVLTIAAHIFSETWHSDGGGCRANYCSKQTNMPTGRRSHAPQRGRSSVGWNAVLSPRSGGQHQSAPKSTV